MASRKVLLACLLAGTLAAIAMPAYSQETTTGTIAGTITDEKGKAIADAVITAHSPQGSRKAISDTNGFFIIPFLTPGNYSLQIIAAGFSTIRQEDIIVKLNERTNVSYAMQPGKVESVTVTGQAPLVDRASTAVGSNIKVADFTATIPMGRTYSNLATTAPGVVSGGGTGAGNFSMGGASGLENSYLIDGVNITNTGYGGIGSYNIIYGSLGTGVTSDFLDEVQVKTGGFEPEFGQALGGIVNALVKSGTNEMKGNFALYSTVHDLEGSRERVRTELGFVNVREQDIYDFAFSYGGPFIKDKLFWFVAINPVETRTSFEAPSVVYPSCVGCSIDISDIAGTQAFPASALGLQERTRRNYNYAGKVSWFPVANHRFDLTFFGDPSRGFKGPQNSASLLFSDFATGGGQSGIRYGANNGTLKYNGVLTPKFFIDAQIAHHDGRFSEDPLKDDYRIRDRRAQLLFLGGELAVGPANFAGGPGFLSQQSDINTTYSVKLTHVIGKHEVKYGSEFADIEYTDDQGYSGPSFNVFFSRSCASAPATACRNDGDCPGGLGDCAGAFNQVPVPTTSGAVIDRRGTSSFRVIRGRFFPIPPPTKNEELSFFAQDTWQVGSRWTLKGGLRATREKVEGSGGFTLPFDSTQPGNVGTTTFTPSSYEFDWAYAPRVGVTFDAVGNGKSKLYTNYARYYERIPNDLAVRSFSNEVSTSRINYSAPGGIDPSTPIHLQGGVTQTGGPTLFGDIPTRVQDGTKLPYVDEYILGYQQQLRPDLAVEVRGIFRYQGRVLEDVQFTSAESIQNYYYGPTVYGYPYDPFPAFAPAPFGEYVLANPGQNTPASAGFPSPKRDYKSFELIVNKTFSNNWAMLANYRYSQLIGNYEGLFRNDNGQSDPNITSLFDFPNSPLMEGQFFRGFLNTDRTHVLNVFPSYRWSNGLTVGGAFSWQSGAPRQPFLAHPVYQNSGEIPGTEPVYAWWTDTDASGDVSAGDTLAKGSAEEFHNDPDALSNLFLFDYRRIRRGFLGRTPDIVTVDVRVNYPIKFGYKYQLNLMFDIFNLVNNQQARDFDDNVESLAGITNPDFLTPTSYGAPRTMRLTASWSF